eukprot:CAMPEP_0168315230 /NCGR_PEP_ID=MMETSP0210-20121227/10526_1 /TAXON_ID=40633 /ORGANISM="Condylostoma magnum, Strain COL2" /LENGTH=38 /DNA_ID= /DNA_START= /DNA_END= /DNA_ORIENTATION=
MTSCSRAIAEWEQKTGQSASEANEVKLIAWLPPINKMD